MTTTPSFDHHHVFTGDGVYLCTTNGQQAVDVPAREVLFPRLDHT